MQRTNNANSWTPVYNALMVSNILITIFTFTLLHPQVPSWRTFWWRFLQQSCWPPFSSELFLSFHEFPLIRESLRNIWCPKKVMLYLRRNIKQQNTQKAAEWNSSILHCQTTLPLLGICVIWNHIVHVYNYYNTRSLEALRAPTSSLRPFEPPWLRPSRPSGTQAVWPPT